MTFQPLLLFLIIFAWTPPHFWALALYRREEYARAGVPMLPVTHGEAYTRLHLLLYTLILVAATLLPFATGMAGWFYLGSALVLDAVFLGYAVAIWRRYSDALAKRTFALLDLLSSRLLFAALMVDHYLPLAGRVSRARIAARARLRGLRARRLATSAAAQRRSRASTSPARRSGGELRLTDHNGQAAHPRGFPRQGRGDHLRLHAMPDVCPTTLADLAKALKQLGPDARARAGALRDRGSRSATSPSC